MTTGGIFKTEELLRKEMEKQCYHGDIRFFKIQIVQEFLKKMFEFRVAMGLMT